MPGSSSAPTTDAPPQARPEHAPPYAVQVDTLLGLLGTDAQRGLSATEAAQRLSQHGKNELAEAPPTPWWRRLARQFHPLGLQFNLAHTSCLVVMAIARHEIGVDAEHLSGRMPAPGVIDRYLTAGERDELLALPGAQRSARFRAICA